MAGDASRRNGQKGGRPPGPSPDTQRKLLALQRLRDRVHAEIDDLLTAELEAAKGTFTVLIQTANGWQKATTEEQIEAAIAAGDHVFRIVRREPDMRALKDLWDRTIGVPKQELEVSTPEPVKITWSYEFAGKCPSCGTMVDAPVRRVE